MMENKKEGTFNLSEKIKTDGSYQDVHVKTFIQKLKEELKDYLGYDKGTNDVDYIIDNLAGRELL